MPSPRVILPPTKLRLKRAQEDALMDFLKKRREEIRAEQGVVGESAYDGWLLERQEAEAQYNNDFSHRRNVARYGPLYQTFNDSSFNLPKRAARVYIARCRESLLNSTPFASLAPEGEEDETPKVTVPGVDPPVDPIKLADRYWNHKLLEADAKMMFRDGLEQAAVCGEVVFKVTKRLDYDEQEDGEEKQIWLDGMGEPLRDARGRYVFADDAFEPHPDQLEGEVLKRDPTVVKFEDAMLSEDTYPDDQKEPKRCLDIKPIDFRNFLCSPTAAGIQKEDTDYIEHTFDMTLDRIWEFTRDRKLNPEAREWRENLKGQNTLNKTDAGKPNENQGEKERGATAPIVLHMAESWITFDSRDRGRCDELYVLWDVTNNYPIYYDLVSEVSPTGKRPFEVVRVLPVKGRWYGQGFYKLLKNEHEYVDRQIARLDARTSTSGRFTWMYEGVIKDVEDGWDIDLNSPKIYTVSQTLQKGQQPINHVELPPMDAGIWKLTDTRLQQAQLMSGTVTSGDAAAANLNPSKTATGQELLSAESDLMSSDTTQDVRRGIEGALRQTLIAVFTDYNEEEASELLGAVNGAKLTEWVKTHKPKSLLKNVALTMTKEKSRLQIEANMQALQVLTGGKSWLDLQQMASVGQVTPEFLESIKPIYASILEANDVEGAKAIMAAPAPQPMMQPPMPGMPGAAPAGQPPMGQPMAGQPMPAPAPPKPPTSSTGNI